MVTAGGGHRHHNLIYPSPPPPLPVHLLELNIISAQDLHPSYGMCTYASAWVDPKHKLMTHVDTAGRANPSWNDKFVFRVEESFLRSDTSAVTIDIHACAHFGKDRVIGTVRVVLSALNPSPATRFVALQVRRPKSLRPQGIINVGVALLDAYIKKLPIDPAFVLKDVMNSPQRMLDRTSLSLPKKLDNGEEWSLPDLSKDNSREWKLERNFSVEVGHRVVEQEAEALESKLEKWRIDLSPLHDPSRKQHKRRASCFCNGNVME